VPGTDFKDEQVPGIVTRDPRRQQERSGEMPTQVNDRPMRDRIIAAAIEVIRERGVTGATTKEIARAARVSEGSLYNHFENKPALFGAAFGVVTSGIRDAMMQLQGQVGQGSVEDNLARLAATAVRFYAELLPMTGTVLANREVRGWLQHDVPATGRGPLFGHALLIGYLEAEQQAGRLAPQAQPPYVAATLLGACQQHPFLTLLAGEAAVAEMAGLPADPDEYARRVVRTILAAQAPQDSPTAR